ncbi:MAG: hypothetical protein EVB11_01740 [Winogradskyella sp.]|nr:MAG: hypothetical protein EVB11_01740 [Winogradskyella sp.]
MFSQENCIEYLYIENSETNYYYEKLILYDNTDFFRIRYNGHSSYSSQEKGNWKRSRDTLSLFGKKINFFPEGNDAEWELSNSAEMHMIRRNYINAYGKYKLKRQRKCQ